MPDYTYRCKGCDRVFSDMNTISKRHTSECKCGGVAERDLDAELAVVGKRHKWVTENERWSRSMGVPVASLAEYRKRYPNSTYDNGGRLLIKSRSDKMRQANERGFVELDNNRR